jgi:hypothetical protein
MASEFGILIYIYSMLSAVRVFDSFPPFTDQQGVPVTIIQPWTWITLEVCPAARWSHRL